MDGELLATLGRYVVLGVLLLAMVAVGHWLGPPAAAKRRPRRGLMGALLFLPWLLVVYPVAFLLGLLTGLSFNRDGGE